MPSIFTVLRVAAREAASVTLSPDGAGTPLTGSDSKGLKTCGKPAWARALVALLNQLGACRGMVSWTAPSTSEPRIDWASTLEEAVTRTLADTQATSSTATAFAAAPPAAVEPAQRPPVQAGAHLPGDPGGDGVARGRRDEDGEQGDERGAGSAWLDVLEHVRQQPHADHGPAEEARERDGARDQSAPVTGDRVGDRQHEQQQVEQVQPRGLSRNRMDQ